MTRVSRFALIVSAFAFLIALAPNPAHADDPVLAPDAILGIWETEHEDDNWSRVEIYVKDGKVHGRIVWLKNPLYDAGEVEGLDNQPRVDLENPDKALRDRPIIGLELMYGFVHNGKNKWDDGRIADPESGKEYRCKVTMKDDKTLEVYGYVKVGFVKMGRNTTWTRVVEGG